MNTICACALDGAPSGCGHLQRRSRHAGGKPRADPGGGHASERSRDSIR